MVTPSRNFEADLLHELKFYSHCEKKIKDHNHYCTSKELAKNLKMSLRDVGPTLRDMVQKGLIQQEDYKLNHTIAKKFIPIDFQIEIIENQKKNIDSYLKSMKYFAQEMRKKPAYTDIKIVSLDDYFGKDRSAFDENDKISAFGYIKQDGIIQSRTYTSKIDKVGERLLFQFCTHATEIFDICDSLTYSLDIGTLDAERYRKEIHKMRMSAFEEISELVHYAVRPLNARQKTEIYKNILIRVKTLFLIDQQKKSSMFKI